MDALELSRHLDANCRGMGLERTARFVRLRQTGPGRPHVLRPPTTWHSRIFNAQNDPDRRKSRARDFYSRGAPLRSETLRTEPSNIGPQLSVNAEIDTSDRKSSPSLRLCTHSKRSAPFRNADAICSSDPVFESVPSGCCWGEKSSARRARNLVLDEYPNIRSAAELQSRNPLSSMSKYASDASSNRARYFFSLFLSISSARLRSEIFLTMESATGPSMDSTILPLISTGILRPSLVMCSASNRTHSPRGTLARAARMSVMCWGLVMSRGDRLYSSSRV